MVKKKFDPQSLYEKLMSTKGFVDNPHFHHQAQEEIKVQIRADKSVSPAKFLPDPLIPGGYKAHPQTIRAMRKDIFVGGEDEFVDLEVLIDCHSCHQRLDLQFWVCCPFCEAELKPPEK